MNKVLIADFEDTLVSVDYVPDEENFPKLYSSNGVITKFIKYHNLLVKDYYEISKINYINKLEKEESHHRKFYQAVLERSSIKNINIDDLVNWRMQKLKFALKIEAVQFLEQAIYKSYKIIIATNALPSRRVEIKKALNNYYIGGIYISSDIGFFKPESNFYKYIIQDLNIKDFENIVYIDDKYNFINSAKKLGIKKSFIIENNKYPIIN